MDQREVSKLVEASEARAYAALVDGAPASLRTAFGLAIRRIGGAYVFVAPGARDSLLLNRVIGLGVWEPSTAALVEHLEALYREHGITTFAAEVPPTTIGHGDALEQLHRAGFIPFRRTTMMYRDCEPLPEAVSDLAVRRVGPAQADRFAQLCCSVFGFSDPFPELLRTSFAQPNFRHWLAFDQDLPVAAAMTIHLDEGVAWIGWVSSLPSHRGRGAQSVLALEQLRECVEQGTRWVTLEAATGSRSGPSPSLRNYKRLGWTPAYDRVVMLRRLPA